MMPATPASRSRRMPSRSPTPPATRKSASVGRRQAGEQPGVGLAPAVRQHEPAHAGADELLDEALDRRDRRAAPGERREALRPRVESHGEPVAGNGQAVGQEAPVIRRRSSRGRPGWPRPRRRGGSGRPPRGRRRAGSGRRRARRSPRRPRGWPARPVFAPSKSTTWTIRAPSSTNRSAIRSGRSVGAPTPADAPGQNTTRERPRSRSIDGMTCTSAVRPGRPWTHPLRWTRRRPGSSSRSSRRWKLIGSEPLFESVSWNARRSNRERSRACSSARSWSSRTLPSRYDSWYVGVYV